MSQIDNQFFVGEGNVLFNSDDLGKYLSEHVADYPNQQLEVKQFSTGFSNLTYFIRSGQWEAVLRRPPSGILPPKAHDMKRESYLLQNLYEIYPYVPKPYVFCEDTAIMGVPFYVMEKKQGVVLDGQFPSGFHATDKIRMDISYAVVDALALLHSIDYEKAGLASFGYPEGFLERQVNSWINRYKKYKTDDLPLFEPLANWLLNNIPKSTDVSIIHNDYKLNNMLFSEDYGKINAILDWEMATIADPFFDLANAAGYWLEPGDPDYLKESLPTVTTNPGFISRQEFIHRYSLKTGKDIPNLNFYFSFNFFKLAIVLQQIYYRWKIGDNTDERFQHFDQRVKNLMLYAYELSATNTY